MFEKIDWKNEYSDEEKTIYLRPMTEDDAETYVNWRNSESVNKYFIYRGKFTVDGQKKWIKDNLEAGKAASMMICLMGEEDFSELGKPIGNVYLLNIDKENSKAEYGIMLGDEAARGKGIGTNAAKLMLKFAFEELGLHRVYLRALEGNERAIKSYENAGFVKEGILKDDVCIDGQYRNIVWMAAIKNHSF